MRRGPGLLVFGGVVALAGVLLGSLTLAAKGASSQSAPADVLEAVSGRQLEATHAISLVAAGPADRAAVGEEQLGPLVEAAGFRAALLERPKLVRLKGGAVPGARGSEGLMWALVVDQDPGLTGTVDRPFRPSPGATGTYLVVFMNAETGEFVMALGGETFGN